MGSELIEILKDISDDLADLNERDRIRFRNSGMVCQMKNCECDGYHGTDLT